MEQEKKEEKKEEVKEVAAAGEKQALQEKTPEKGPSETSEKAKKAERPKNCARCNKPIKRKTWYYRNGKYFCGKGCWKLSQKKAA